MGLELTLLVLGVLLFAGSFILGAKVRAGVAA